MFPYDIKYCPHELTNVTDFTRGFRCHDPLYDIAVNLCQSNVWAEFGVGMGFSARRWLNRLTGGRLFLFDSWQGIPDDWDLGKTLTNPKGTFRAQKPTLSDKRATFIDGLFSETLPFLFGQQVGIVHIDCDVYSSARDVLFGLGEAIGAGTVLVFDELIGYENYAKHEYKALCEWRESTGHRVEWFAKERFAAVGVVT